MPWPTNSLTKTHFDAGTDSPANARAELEALYDHVNLISAEVTDGATVWHSDNDGPTSGLSAQYLGGQDSSFFLNASNLNAGTVPLARLPMGNGNGLDADKLDGQHGSYYLDLNNATGDVSTSQIENDAVTQAKIAANAVGQSEIKETYADTSVTASSTIAETVYVSSAGGFKLSTELRAASTIFNWVFIDAIDYMQPSTMTTSAGSNARKLRAQTTGSSQTAYARDVYIQASPPHSIGGLDFGDLFVFLKLDDDGEIISVSIAEDPPWYHNGPTSTKPTRVTKNKKYINKLILPENYKSLPKKLQFQALAAATVEEVEIDESIKNADMDLIPNPYLETNENKIILLEPDGKFYQDLINIRKNGGDLMEIMHSGYIKIGADSNVGSHQKPKNCKMKKVTWK